MLKSILKQRVNIQFCVLNETLATRKLNDPVADYSSLVAKGLVIAEGAARRAT
jgi:hypothetical protein